MSKIINFPAIAKYMWEFDPDEEVESYKTEYCSHTNNEKKPNKLQHQSFHCCF